jgi:putative ABC transport system substrate-binding protein
MAMKRREFITFLAGAAAAACPFDARAQQEALPVVGLLAVGSVDEYGERLRAFQQGLAEFGYIQDRNIAIEYRWAEGQYQRMPAMAADLVHRNVAVMAALGDSAALAAKAATSATPIVFSGGNDPVALGLVNSLNQPGANITGVTNLNVEIAPKRLELVRQIVPTATTVGLLVNPTGRNAEVATKNMQAAAHTFGLQLDVLRASTPAEIVGVFKGLQDRHIGALVIGPDAFFNNQSPQLGTLSTQSGVPTIFETRAFAVAGGLMSYGASITEPVRLVGVYVARILKGQRPADLPVQQATKVELFINLKTAKYFGLTIPVTLLGRADEVIE